MWHFSPNYHNPYPLTIYTDIYCLGDLLSKQIQAAGSIIIKVKEIIHFYLWHNKRMAFYKWIDIKKSITIFVLCNFVAGNLTSNYLTENTRHLLDKYLQDFKSYLTSRRRYLYRFSNFLSKQTLSYR